MKARIQILFCVPLLLLLTSCYPGTRFEVVNHTPQVLTIVSMDTELKETAYSVPPAQTVRIAVPYKLRVEYAGKAWNYDLPRTPAPKEFRKPVGGNWYLEKYQIESDGKIYALLPDTQGPAVTLPEQPTG